MITIELPVVFCKNFTGVNQAISQGLSVPEREEVIDNATFYFSEFQFIRVNPAGDANRTTIFLGENDSYVIDADYETVNTVIKTAINNSRKQ